MRPLTGLERFLERLFERPGTRLFRPAIQPIQIQRRIERAMELQRHAEAGRVSVPSSFVVRLHPTDLPSDPDVSRALAADLADAALRFARAHRYVVSARPSVTLVADPTVGRREIDVRAATRPSQDVAVGGGVTASAEAGDRESAPPRAVPDPPAEGTAAYVVPRARIPATVVRSVEPGGRERRHEIATATLTIGRAPDNDVVLEDRRVSRHHARLTARAGGIVFTDLDSTNGSIVNGIRAREVALGPGDRIDLGRSVLFIESVGEEAPSAEPPAGAVARES